jgi:hypothetical protein
MCATTPSGTPDELRDVFDVVGERRGRVDHILGEGERLLGEQDVDLREALFSGLVELHAVLHEVDEGLLEEALAAPRERAGLRGLGVGGEGRVEGLREDDAAVVLAHLALHGGVGLAEILGADRGLEVPREPEGVVEAVRRHVEGAHGRVVGEPALGVDAWAMASSDAAEARMSSFTAGPTCSGRTASKGRFLEIARSGFAEVIPARYPRIGLNPR